MIFSAVLFFASFVVPWPPLQVIGPGAVFLICGLPLALESMGTILELDIHVLMLVAAFASAFIGHAAEGALLLLLFATSHEVEERISMQAGASLDALSRLSPEVARRLPTGETTLGSSEGKEVKAAELRAGDCILVRAGEVVPVDGEVVDGVSLLGLDHLTGEPLPQSVGAGGVAMSGAKNIDGPLVLKVLRPASESTIQRIIRLTSSATESRPRLVTFLDAIGKKWSMFVVASTAAIATLPALVGVLAWNEALYRALVWLITASPCALLLATPLVYVSTISMAASKGVLLKGGRTLDALALSTGIAFDKTGTITTGCPELQRVEVITSQQEKMDTIHLEKHEEKGLVIAAALGQMSVHPVSRALALKAPKGGGSHPAAVNSFSLVPGSGLFGEVTTDDGEFKVVLGKPSYVAEFLGKHDKALQHELTAKSSSMADVVDADGTVSTALAAVPVSSASSKSSAKAEAWVFHLGDRVKASAREVLPRVAASLPVYMLTGDRDENAHRVAESLRPAVNFKVHAGLSPEEKLEKVREYDAVLQKAAADDKSLQGHAMRALGVSAGGLVMVGDGVNDAPALAASRVGISLASQADGAMPTNAIESSDVLVLRRAGDPSGDADLERVEWIMSVAGEARSLVMQNLMLAGLSIVGASVYTLAAGLPLWIGVLVHEGATVLVALNSLRIFRHRG